LLPVNIPVVALNGSNGHKPIVKELLRRNCDYDTKNSAGKEAWELAFEFNFDDLGGYIRDKTGLPPLPEGVGGAAPSKTEQHAESQGEGGVKQNEEDDDDELFDLVDLPGLDAPEKKPVKADDRASESGGEKGKPDALPQVDLRKSGVDPLGSIGLPKKKSEFDPLGSVGLPNKKTSEFDPLGSVGLPSKTAAPLPDPFAKSKLGGVGGAGEGGAGVEGKREKEKDRDKDRERERDRDRGGGGGVKRESKGETWRDKIDFTLLTSALVALANGSNHIANSATLEIDTAFWAQIEGIRETVGLPKIEQRAKGLENVVEKLWGRYALFQSEDVEGVRLQSELRGLLSKMGAGADLDTVLEERDRLKVKMGDTDRLATDLAAKLRLLEKEVKDSATRLDEARRESEEQQSKLRTERRAKEAGEARCRELETERDDLQRELSDAKDNAAAERRALNGLRGDLNKVKNIKVSWLSASELDDLFRRHDRDNSGDISAEEMKPFVEELCSIMERRMTAVKDESIREAQRADHAEADRERDKERAKEAEARLNKQIERLEQDLEMSDNAARSQAQQLQERMDKQVQMCVCV
jgi:hypothetical protein